MEAQAVRSVPYTDEVQTVLVAASKERGFTSPLWVSAKAITKNEKIRIKDHQDPIAVSETDGKVTLYFNIQQIANPQLVDELRINFAAPPRSGLSGKVLPANVAKDLPNMSTTSGQSYWVTEPQLPFFTPVLEVMPGERPVVVQGVSYYHVGQLTNPEVLECHVKNL